MQGVVFHMLHDITESHFLNKKTSGFVTVSIFTCHYYYYYFK